MSDQPARPPAIPASLELGRLIARARVDAGLEQTHLADRLGCSVRTISLIENGHRPIRTTQELATIAGILGITPQTIRNPTRRRPEGLPFAAVLAGLTDEQLDQVVREARAEQHARRRR